MPPYSVTSAAPMVSRKTCPGEIGLDVEDAGAELDQHHQGVRPRIRGLHSGGSEYEQVLLSRHGLERDLLGAFNPAEAVAEADAFHPGYPRRRGDADAVESGVRRPEPGAERIGEKGVETSGHLRCRHDLRPHLAQEGGKQLLDAQVADDGGRSRVGASEVDPELEEGTLSGKLRPLAVHQGLESAPEQGIGQNRQHVPGTCPLVGDRYDRRVVVLGEGRTGYQAFLVRKGVPDVAGAGPQQRIVEVDGLAESGAAGAAVHDLGFRTPLDGVAVAVEADRDPRLGGEPGLHADGRRRRRGVADLLLVPGNAAEGAALQEVELGPKGKIASQVAEHGIDPGGIDRKRLSEVDRLRGEPFVEDLELGDVEIEAGEGAELELLQVFGMVEADRHRVGGIALVDDQLLEHGHRSRRRLRTPAEAEEIPRGDPFPLPPLHGDPVVDLELVSGDGKRVVLHPGIEAHHADRETAREVHDDDDGPFPHGAVLAVHPPE